MPPTAPSSLDLLRDSLGDHPALSWAAVMAPIAAAVIAGSLVLHRKTIGFLPEDPPGRGRKNHPQHTPLIGVVLGPLLLVWVLICQQWWLASGALLAIVVGGFDDARKWDGRELDWRIKAAGLVFAAALGTVQVALGTGWEPWQWIAVWGFLFVVINALNFMDNTDGVMAVLAAVGLLATGTDVGAGGAWLALGFLPFNWPRARVFSGDGLALPLGLVLGVGALQAGLLPAGLRPSGMCAPCVLAPVAILLLDFVQVMGARLYLGVAPWIGDRRHLTHVSMNLGLPRLWVAPVFAVLAIAAWLLGIEWASASAT